MPLFVVVAWKLLVASDPFMELLVPIRLFQLTGERIELHGTTPVVLSVLFVVAVDFLVRIVAVRRMRRHQISQSGFAINRRRWRWVALPVALLIMTSPHLYNWPLKVRFELSRSAFEREAARLRSSPRKFKFTHYRWVGLYCVSSYEPPDDDWQCFVEGPTGQSPCTWFYTGGMAWSVVGPIDFTPGVLFHFRPASDPPPDDYYWSDYYHPELASPPWYIYYY